MPGIEGVVGDWILDGEGVGGGSVDGVTTDSDLVDGEVRIGEPVEPDGDEMERDGEPVDRDPEPVACARTTLPGGSITIDPDRIDSPAETGDASTIRAKAGIAVR